MKHHYMKVTKIPLYPGVLILVFTEDMEALIKEDIVSKKELEEYGIPYACTYFNGVFEGQPSFIIVLNFWEKLQDPISIGLICHEVNHCGNRILDYVHSIPDYNNDETESYLKGWIGDQIQEMMVEHGINLKGFENVKKK